MIEILIFSGLFENGVQEAAGSNPVTRTKREVIERLSLFFYLLTQRTSGLLPRRSRDSIRREVRKAAKQIFPLVRIQSLGPKIDRFRMGLVDFSFLLDSKAGSWRQSSGLSQPAWLFRRKANPFESTNKKATLTGGFLIGTVFTRRGSKAGT